MHKFKQKLGSNELSMVWVESEKCIYCGISKNSPGAEEMCDELIRILMRGTAEEHSEE